MRTYFLQTQRIGFSHWQEEDLPLARALWSNARVTQFICKSGVFTEQEIERRFLLERENGRLYGVEYWPMFQLSDGGFIGCCGLRPFEAEENSYELGYHLCEKYWGRGLASEAAVAVVRYAFDELSAKNVYAGHHPENGKSGKILERIGFHSIGTKFYPPTGLYHPAYSYR